MPHARYAVTIMPITQPTIVALGGGTGSFAILHGLRDSDCMPVALVNMADDGGSTGVLRRELGVLPPGDVRHCLHALSQAPAEIRELFEYRFTSGSLAGHPLGNLFLSAAEKSSGSFSEAIELASSLLQVKGKVLPITLDNVELSITWNGQTVRGQRAIDDTLFPLPSSPPELSLTPAAHIADDAARAIRGADLIVITPGDIYTSLGPIFAVAGVSEALQQTKARIVYVSNLAIKPGHTTGFTVSDHATEIERLVGAPILDTILYNTGQPDPALYEPYITQGALMVTADQDRLAKAHYKAIGADLLAPGIANSRHGDALAARRSFIRHNSTAVAKELFSLLR